MITTLELFARVKEAHGNCSDYRATKLLGISTNNPHSWRTRDSVMSDETAIKAALLCNLDVEYVLACIAAERAKNSDAFPMWKHICERLQPSNMAA